MSPIEAGQLKRWLDDSDAVMLAFVELGSFVVLIRSTNPSSPHIGIGESPDDLEAAIREAQHRFDLGVFRATKNTTRVVGLA